jgi:hypothetical protein
MSRIELIDTILRELHRQARVSGKFLKVMPAHSMPDCFNVIGILDIDALAKAIRDER